NNLRAYSIHRAEAAVPPAAPVAVDPSSSRVASLSDREAEAYLILVEEPPVAKASSPAEVGVWDAEA
ncbi:hypothetical protein FRX31_007334, partial [Thalictrum thalictroides]